MVTERKHLLRQNGAGPALLSEKTDIVPLERVIYKILDAAFGATDFSKPESFAELIWALHMCDIPEKEESLTIELLEWGVQASVLAGAPVRTPFRLVAMRLAIHSDLRGWVTEAFASRMAKMLKESKEEKEEGDL